MRGIARFAAVSLLSAAVAGALAWLPRIDGANGLGKAEWTVFGQDRSRGLTEQNLVDRILRLPLQLDIRRADWNEHVLSLDFTVYGRPQTYALYHDFCELSRLLETTPNIVQVAVRVVEAKPGEPTTGGQLLVAMDARKEDFAKPHSGTIPEGGENMKRYLQTLHRLTFTQRWKDPAS